MQRLFAVVLAVACVVGSTPVLARGGGGGHGGGRGGFVRSGPIVGNPAPQIPFENRIPAPLAAPAQAPVINGPMSQPSFRGMTGIGQ
jgi:hypothetical protein